MKHKPDYYAKKGTVSSGKDGQRKTNEIVMQEQATPQGTIGGKKPVSNRESTDQNINIVNVVKS